MVKSGVQKFRVGHSAELHAPTSALRLSLLLGTVLLSLLTCVGDDLVGPHELIATHRSPLQIIR